MGKSAMIVSLHFDNCTGRSAYACDLPTRRDCGGEARRAGAAGKSIGRIVHFNLVRKVQVFDGVETGKDYPGKNRQKREPVSEHRRYIIRGRKMSTAHRLLVGMNGSKLKFTNSSGDVWVHIEWNSQLDSTRGLIPAGAASLSRMNCGFSV